MAIAVTMPQMGESVVEGTIEKWCVSEGDRVEKDQILCEITTDKVDAEIPAPEAGIVSRILVPEGQTVEVATELALIEPTGVTRQAAAAPQEERPETSAREAATGARTTSEPSETPERPSPRASPVARRMAEEQGIDLEGVTGSGVAGRITKADLLAALERERTPAGAVPQARQAKAPPKGVPETLGEWLGDMHLPTYAPREGDQVIPFSTIRRRVAEHMVVSKIVSPHVGIVAEVDLHKLFRLRETLKAEFKRSHGFNLTYLPFVVEATVGALKEFPRLNASVVGEAVVERAGIHIGVAVETEKGLLVPVIRDTDRLSLIEVAEAIEDLSRRARQREISADELHGGTFTVTNPGREGNLYGFAVINQPQVGILRMGELKKRPVVVEQDGHDAIAVHPLMHLALSYDHRIIDGVTGNGFLYRVARYLEAAEFVV
jgi:2-oxoglutarate dehydrogenase E2 component (dihydrolipoamide succinyltransferase)